MFYPNITFDFFLAFIVLENSIFPTLVAKKPWFSTNPTSERFEEDSLEREERACQETSRNQELGRYAR